MWVFCPLWIRNNKLVGVVGLRDLFLWNSRTLVNFVTDVDFVHDFGAVETTLPTRRTQLDRIN